jgi:hypothetical protein
MHKPFKKPDLHAPRKRQQVKDFLAYPHKDPYGFFARLKQQNPQLEKYTNKEIGGWITSFNKQMADDVANTRHGVTLPQGLGKVLTGICKPTEVTASNNIDYATSQKLGFQVRYRNGNTDGFLAKIYYINNMPRCRFKKYYQCRFKPCRALSRAVSKVMKTDTGYKQYIHFTQRASVAGMFNKTKRQRPDWRKRKLEALEALSNSNYDEFCFDRTIPDINSDSSCS